MMTSRVFIVHGWEGSPEGNWFPWLKQTLEKRGIEALVPQMPDPKTPTQEEWLRKLDEVVDVPDSDTYFVGHSLGCITILRYLQHMNGNAKIGGAVLVAGFTDDLGIEHISDFFKEKIEWPKITSRCSKFVVINSDNDPYVAPRYNEILSKELNARKLVQPGMGHFNMKELHVALNELLKLMKDRTT